MNFIIADSGGNNTNWAIVEDNKVTIIETIGLNPYFAGDDDFSDAIHIIKNGITSALKYDLRFYGSGLGNESNTEYVLNQFNKYNFFNSVELYDDLLAAGRAIYNKKSGFVAILGTGSNFGYYSSPNIITRIPSLGFILGDEGSGAYMGKILVKKYLSNQLSKETTDKFKDYIQLNQSEILHKIYFQNRPNKFLSELTHFISTNKQSEEIGQIIETAFDDFTLWVKGFDPSIRTISFVGSIASIFKEELARSLSKENILIDKVLDNPIHGLIDFHKS